MYGAVKQARVGLLSKGAVLTGTEGPLNNFYTFLSNPDPLFIPLSLRDSFPHLCHAWPPTRLLWPYVFPPPGLTVSLYFII